MRVWKQLGVTEAGLKLLARASVNPHGLAEGAGSGLNGTARIPLARSGFITVSPDNRWIITTEGRALVTRARSLGW